MSLPFVLLRFRPVQLELRLSGNDGGLEKIFEISSLAMNFRVEAWERRVTILLTVGTPVVDTIGA